MIRITSLYWSHTSPMVFCIQHRDFSPKTASHYGSQPSSVVFACKKKRLYGHNYKSVWVPDLTYGFLHSKQRLYHQNCKSLWDPALICCIYIHNSDIMTRIIVSMGPRPHLTLCACKTTRLASKLLVSMGPSLHLWVLHPKLRLYDQNYKSLLVPHLTNGFLHSTQGL